MKKTIKKTKPAKPGLGRSSAEPSLENSERRFQSLIENASDLILTLNPDYTITYVSPSVERILGYTVAAVTGARITDFIHPQDLPDFIADTEQRARTPGPSLFPRQVRVRHADGSWRTVEGMGNNLLDQAGVSGLVINARDITKRKRTQEALRESHQLLERTFASLQDAIFIIDANTTAIMDCNPAAADIFGYSREDMLGRVTGFLHVDQTALEEFRKLLSPAVAEKGFLFLSEFKMKRKDGTAFPTEHTVMPLEDEQGRRIGWVSVVRDITEHKHAEEQFRALFTRQQAILAAVPDIIVEVDKDKIFTWANPAGLAFYGEDLIGKKAAFYFEGEQDTYSQVKPLFDGSEDVIYVESWQRRKDGEKRLLAWWCRVLKDSVGNVIGAISSAHDITERKRVEEALRTSEERLRVGLNTANIAVFNQDRDLRYIWMYQPQLGFTPEQVTGHTDADLLPVEAAKQVMEIKRRVLEGGLKEHAEVPVSVGGQTFVYDLVAEPLRDANGTIIGLTGATLNMTERKRSEEALRESEQRYRLATNAGRTAVWRADLLTGQVESEGTLERLIGYEPSDVAGNEGWWMEATHPDDREQGLDAWQDCSKGKRDRYDIEHRIYHKDGSIHWLEIRAQGVRDSEGRIVAIAGTTRDITERKSAEEELAHRADQLRELAVRLSQVEEAERRALASQLHDRVGQNLTALSINLNIIRSQLSGKPAETVGARLGDSLALVTETIERTRDVMGNLHPPVLDDYGLFAALRWYSDRFSKWTDITVLFEGEELEPRLAPDVESTLFRIAQEALTNVAKHAHAKTVTLTLDRADAGARLIIADDGVGFDPAHTAPRGWGMITMRERAAAVGGRARVESAPGKGTRVIVELVG